MHLGMARLTESDKIFLAIAPSFFCWKDMMRTSKRLPAQGATSFLLRSNLCLYSLEVAIFSEFAFLAWDAAALHLLDERIFAYDGPIRHRQNFFNQSYDTAMCLDALPRDRVKRGFLPVVEFCFRVSDILEFQHVIFVSRQLVSLREFRRRTVLLRAPFPSLALATTGGMTMFGTFFHEPRDFPIATRDMRRI